MVFENVTFQVGQFVAGLSLADAQIILQPLVMLVIGMVVYALFVFKFYKFIARRDIFRLSEGGGTSWGHRIVYALEYLFLFPVIAFVWFFVIAVLLAMFSEIVLITNIFVSSMAVLATIRIAAYYDEELSREIAKLIPLALLAIFLLDITSVSADAMLQVLRQLPPLLEPLLYYFVFIVAIELILRSVADWRRSKSKKQEIYRKVKFNKGSLSV